MINNILDLKRNITVDDCNISGLNKNDNRDDESLNGGSDENSHNVSFLKLNYLNSFPSVVQSKSSIDSVNVKLNQSDQEEVAVSKIKSNDSFVEDLMKFRAGVNVRRKKVSKKKFITNDFSNYCIPSPPATPVQFYSSQTEYLRQNMVFKGHQISGYKSYEVVITLNNVSLPNQSNAYHSNEPHLTGSLTIKNLTAANPEITTYFDSYVVTSNNQSDCQFGFLTSSWLKNNSIDLDMDESLYNFLSDDDTDAEHWLNFNNYRHVIRSSYNEYQSNHQFHKYSEESKYDKKLSLLNPTKKDKVNFEDFLNGNIDLNMDNYTNQRYIFMRWKERFLLPSGTDSDDAFLDYSSNIRGANFDGYYYILHDQLNGSIKGFYYHPKATKFQQLELYPVEQNKLQTLTSNYYFS